ICQRRGSHPTRSPAPKAPLAVSSGTIRSTLPPDTAIPNTHERQAKSSSSSPPAKLLSDEKASLMLKTKGGFRRTHPGAEAPGPTTVMSASGVPGTTRTASPDDLVSRGENPLKAIHTRLDSCGASVTAPGGLGSGRLEGNGPRPPREGDADS